MEIGLSLGSNLGDRLANLRAAREAIVRLAGVALAAQAPIYETEPVGVKPEYAHLKFLNTVLILASQRPVALLQRELAELELALGRNRVTDKFAPRHIDVDVLFAGNLWMETESLTLPHPRWAHRRFVVQPLADVRPDLVLPGMHRTVREVLAALPPGEAVSEFARDW